MKHLISYIFNIFFRFFTKTTEETAEETAEEKFFCKAGGIEKVVENICFSLRNKQHEWEIDAYTIKHKPSGIEFWKTNIISFFGVWDGQTTQVIFNEEQCERISAAYKDMLQDKVTLAEQELIDNFL